MQEEQQASEPTVHTRRRLGQRNRSLDLEKAPVLSPRRPKIDKIAITLMKKIPIILCLTIPHRLSGRQLAGPHPNTERQTNVAGLQLCAQAVPVAGEDEESTILDVTLFPWPCQTVAGKNIYFWVCLRNKPG